MVTCRERANLKALSYVMFSSASVTSSCGVLDQLWYLIVSIPDPCLLTYFECYCYCVSILDISGERKVDIYRSVGTKINLALELLFFLHTPVLWYGAGFFLHKTLNQQH